MPKLSNRINIFTDSVIRRMTRISEAYGAINLSQGFPDFDPPKEILDALANVTYNGPHQYSLTYGSYNLRNALAKKHGKAIHRTIDPDTEVLVTCGGTEAMISAMMTVCNPGDNVIIFSPFYENYMADTILSGANPIYVPLNPPDYSFDKQVLEDAFRRNVKAIIICNPSNPTGKVFTKEELEFIGCLALEHDAYVITDEVYEHIIYEPFHHIHMAGIPDMYDNVITCSSLSKTYSITGWRLGYLIGPEKVIENTKKVHDFLTICAPAPLQEAACVGVNFDESYYKNIQKLYTEKRDYFCRRLDDIGLVHSTPQGTYFVMLDISEFLLMDRFKGWTDMQFCEWMIKEIGVAAVPGSSFFREPVNNLIRLHFARSRDTLDEVLNRLKRLTGYLR